MWMEVPWRLAKHVAKEVSFSKRHAKILSVAISADEQVL
jgi:hypothetical protein